MEYVERTVNFILLIITSFTDQLNLAMPFQYCPCGKRLERSAVGEIIEVTVASVVSVYQNDGTDLT